MSITATKVEPKIWVGCLACYNDGRLVGEWLEPDDVDGVSTDDVRNLIHKEHPAPNVHGFCEEVWVMDHEGFGGLLKGECSPWEAAEIAKVIAYCDEVGMPLGAFAAWRDNVDATATPTTELVDTARDAYLGEWDNLEAYAWDYLDDQLDALPEWVQSHRGAIVKDWARDAEHTMTTADAPGGVYVFTS